MRDFMNYKLWQWVLLALILTPSIYTDLKKREINPWLIVTGIPAGILLDFFLIGIPFSSEYFVRFLPGIAMLLAAWLFRGSIGIGDGIICLFLGSVLHINYVFSSMMLGFLFASLYGLILITVKKMNGKAQIPFVPFLSIGVVLCGII